MYLYFIIGICIIVMVAVLWKLFSIEKFYSDVYNKYFVEQNTSFLSKVDLIFNRVMQSKEEDQKRIFYTLEPISRIIEDMRKKMEEIEKNRLSFDRNFLHSIENVKVLQKEMREQTSSLRDETARIVRAFKSPNFRGHWGEVHLKRVVEIAGMIPHCDFETQVDMGEVRPDMVIKLPNGGIVIVDAKTPMEAFLKFYEGESEEQFKKENVDAFKKIIKNLGEKKYWVKGKTPEFVIMYIPTESLWLNALATDESLFEYSAERNVLVATPMTLISLLKTVAYGWSQLKLAEESESLKQMIVKLMDYLLNLEKVTHDSIKSFHQCGKNLSNLAESMERIKRFVDNQTQNIKNSVETFDIETEIV